ncbi:MAG: RNA chaperone Hfq [Christensenellales bacterium]|jgi:host factor-I protein
MAKTTIILQDVFLNLVRKERMPITVVLGNATQIKGTVKGFDSFTVILEAGAEQLLIYKNAIAYIQANQFVLN